MLIVRGKKSEDLGFPVHAVIFDLDGTLIDTVDVYFDILQTAMQKIGLPPVSRATILDAAEDGDFEWDKIIHDSQKGRKEELLKQLWAIIQDISLPIFQQRATLIPGADDCLRTISGAGAKIGLVTSTKKRYLEAKMLPLRRSGINEIFDAILTADDVSMKKPSPEPLLECARKLGVGPGNSIHVGDMRTDIIAGKAAGMMTIGVLTGFEDYGRLNAENPDMILKSVKELKEKLIP